MAHARTHRLLRLVALGLAAIPFAFGAIRFVQTGTDERYLWVALAEAAGAAAALSVLRRRSGRGLLVVAAFFVATACGVLAGQIAGTHLGPGLLVVAVGFAVCFAAAAGGV